LNSFPSLTPIGILERFFLKDSRLCSSVFASLEKIMTYRGCIWRFGFYDIHFVFCLDDGDINYTLSQKKKKRKKENIEKPKKLLQMVRASIQISTTS
jgi:hypothetical protein